MPSSNDVEFSDYTVGEKIHLVSLIARMAKRGVADDGTGRVIEDLKRKAERIEERARRRKERARGA